MNINASIIDQRIGKLAAELAPDFGTRLNIKNNEIKVRSTAFVFLMVKTLLDLDREETLDALTEGGSDFGVDAVEVSDVQDGEFAVTLFQAKYAQDLEGTKNFPENGVTKAIQAVRLLFDPQAAITVNQMLRIKVEEIRSLIQDGNLPRVRFVLCNNGLAWTKQAQELIDRERFPGGVIFEHANHDTIIKLLQSALPIEDTLRFHGKALVENFDFVRVFVGKIGVTEIADLLSRYGDRLLEKNIRRFLGIHGNRVNEGIRQTLTDPAERVNFYFYNNGITLICAKFRHNALQVEDHHVRVNNLQIINGGQTCRTIESTVQALGPTANGLENAFVLVRLYELPEASHDLVRTITFATNNQNPVDLRDLRSNDNRQLSVQSSLAELGFNYRRQRGEDPPKPTDITSATAAEAVLSVWRRRPQQAKFMTREHFGKLYEVIFTPELNGAQVVIATLLFRIAENLRKRPPEDSPPFLPYAGAFIAMIMGEQLIADLGCKVSELDHRRFDASRKLVDQNGDIYAQRAIERLSKAISLLYGGSDISLQRLSATFRRGDLFAFLELGDLL